MFGGPHSGRYDSLLNWLHAFPALLCLVLLVFGPGATVGKVAGLRGVTLWAASAPMSLSLLGVAAVFAQGTHMRWGIWPILLVSILAAGTALLLRVLVFKASIRTCLDFRPKWTIDDAGRRLWPYALASFGIVAAMSFRVVGLIVEAPSRISQTYDNVFHLNAIQFILSTGNASPLAIADLNPENPSGFYPAIWHVLVSAACQFTGATIPVGQSAMIAVTASLIWPLSAFYLTTRIMGNRISSYFCALPFIVAFAQFPFHLIDFGVLYPTFLAYSLLPVLLALIVMVFGLAAPPHEGYVQPLLVAATSAPGILFAHPSAFLAAGLFTLPILVVWFWRHLKSASSKQTPWKHPLLALVFILVFVSALVLMWTKIRPSKAASFWPPTMRPGQAMGEALTLSALTPYVPWVLSIFVALGIVTVLRRRGSFWIVACFAMAVFLYGVVAGFPQGAIRDFFTQVWYNDAHRVATLLPMFGVPLAALGLRFLGMSLQHALVQLRPSTKALRFYGASALAISALASGLLAVILQVPRLNQPLAAVISHAKSEYTLNEKSDLLTSDEDRLLQRLSQHVPSGRLIMANPGTGASLAYSLAGRRTNLLAVGSSSSAEDKYLVQHLVNLNSDPKVCGILDRRTIDFVLDFGPQEINNMKHAFPSSADLAAVSGLSIVDQEGAAKLYAITGCKK